MEFKNRNPLIYVIAGLARNGKDTIASDILNYYSKLGIKGINLQFSSYIKEYAKNISSWDGSDENKPRELLQQLGTELIRNKIIRTWWSLKRGRVKNGSSSKTHRRLRDRSRWSEVGFHG